MAVLAGAWLGGAVLIAALSVKTPSWAPYLSVLGVLGTGAVVAHHRRVTVSGLLRDALREDGWRGAVVGSAVLAAIVAASARLPSVVSAGYAGLERSVAPLAQRDIAPLASYGSVQAVAAANERIPRGASFGVDYGGEGPSPVPLLFMLWLAPRDWIYPYTGSAAGWVIVYGVPLPAGLAYTHEIVLAPGVYLLKVR